MPLNIRPNGYKKPGFVHRGALVTNHSPAIIS